jgi:uncharacterized protein
MPVKNATRKTILASKVVMCDTESSRALGLMFHSKITDAAFILAFPKEQHVALHMFFVFFPIDVAFIDEKKNVVEIKENFEPFTQYSARKHAKYAVELPNETIAKTKTAVGDRIEF